MRLIISSNNCEYQVQALNHQGNILIKTIWKRVNVNRDKEVDDEVKGMKRLQEMSTMFKATKMLNYKKIETPFVHDENGMHVSNPEEVNNINKRSLQTSFL